MYADHQQRMMEDVCQLARALAARGAWLVLLFGSLAEGRAGIGSDVDLVVVIPGVENTRFHQRLGDAPEVEEFPHPLDLLVYSPNEWERVQARWFFRNEVAKGVVLHGHL